jgi:hypothetical protein
MRNAILFASISALAFNHAARADGGPSHVKVAQCSPLIRQELLTIVGHPLVIAFPQGESTWLAPMSGKADPSGTKQVEPSVEGFKPDEIQKQPIRNLFTLWPDAPGVTTFTVVAQTADGTLKTYPFTLTAIPDVPGSLDIAAVTLNLICKSGAVAAPVASPPPGSPVPAVRITAPRKPVISSAERAEAEERLRTDAFNGIGDQVCHYHAKGKKPSAIEPLCPMDNGQWTLVRFKGLTRKPAIYVGSCEDGNDEERLAHQHQAGDLVVVEEIAPQFCLRLGSNSNDVLEIINDHYVASGDAPDTGTLTPTVRRDLIQARTH